MMCSFVCVYETILYQSSSVLQICLIYFKTCRHRCCCYDCYYHIVVVVVILMINQEEVLIEILVCDGEGMVLKNIVHMKYFFYKSFLKKRRRGEA